MPHVVERAFPNLGRSGYAITSPQDRNYNCIAWAAGDTSRFWWPTPFSYWPGGAQRELTLTAFDEAFRTLRYEPCADGEREEEFEKVALYAKDGLPTHMARQLESGAWTSKLGQAEDIRHEDVFGVAGSIYGSVCVTTNVSGNHRNGQTMSRQAALAVHAEAAGSRPCEGSVVQQGSARPYDRRFGARCALALPR